MTTFSTSERKACELLGVWRSSCRYQLKPDGDSQLRERLTELARQRPRFGYRRPGVLLARDGQLRLYLNAGGIDF